MCCEQKKSGATATELWFLIHRIRDSTVQGHEKEPLGERQYAMPGPHQVCHEQTPPKWWPTFLVFHSLRPTKFPVSRLDSFCLVLLPSLPNFRLSFTSESRQRVLVDGGYGDEEKERLGELQPEAWRSGTVKCWDAGFSNLDVLISSDSCLMKLYDWALCRRISEIPLIQLRAFSR